jgi:hypothetical protein
MTMSSDSIRPAAHLELDALPDPEPAAPSLPAPDPGVFHHDVTAPTPPAPSPGERETA